ncbi:MAG: hypothetical protein WCO34_14400, partial [Betaproteobacteria bacterium]
RCWPTRRTASIVFIRWQFNHAGVGPAPKVIWLKIRNQSRAATLKILLDHQLLIEEALLNRKQACVEISGA